jgi:hypothetical protein
MVIIFTLIFMNTKLIHSCEKINASPKIIEVTEWGQNRTVSRCITPFLYSFHSLTLFPCETFLVYDNKRNTANDIRPAVVRKFFVIWTSLAPAH